MNYCTNHGVAMRDVALYCSDCVDARTRAERHRLSSKLLEEAAKLDARAASAKSDAARGADLIAAGTLRGLADNLGPGPDEAVRDDVAAERKRIAEKLRANARTKKARCCRRCLIAFADDIDHPPANPEKAVKP